MLAWRWRTRTCRKPDFSGPVQQQLNIPLTLAVVYYILEPRGSEVPMSIPRKQRFISLAKALGIALLALTLAGIVYEQIGRRRDRNHYPQIGQSIDIGGRTLNIFCSGEGSPTVVLDSGGILRVTPGSASNLRLRSSRAPVGTIAQATDGVIPSHPPHLRGYRE